MLFSHGQIDFISVLHIIHTFLLRKPLRLELDEDGALSIAEPLAPYWQAAVWSRVFGALLGPDAHSALQTARRELAGFFAQNPARARLVRIRLARAECDLGCQDD